MLKSPEVQAANIYNLSDYNDKIRKYINDNKDNWQDIVTKIEVMFPFRDDLRGIEIIDSPGVCARGGVAEITSKYIENADAIIFLKPVSGQALESSQFNQFMKNASVERNKNALFLVLTRATNVTEADLRRLEDEAHKQFSNLDKENILIVDSKAELYSKNFARVDNLPEELCKLKQSGTLDDFVVTAYSDITIFGSGNTQDFIDKLKEKSRFQQVYDALNSFGRKAHYILMAALLDSINNLYTKLGSDTNSKIDMYKQKAEDPTELAKKIAEIKQELDDINFKMYKEVDNVVQRFRGDDGIIRTTADAEKEDFKTSVGKIAPYSNNAFEQLENLSLKKIDQFKKLTETIQHQAVAEFDKDLGALSDKSSIPFESLKPNFTDATFKEIKDSTKSKAYETNAYVEGVTFKTTHEYPIYVQNKHFNIIYSDILGRLDALENNLVDNLCDFVEEIRKRYIEELSNSAEGKKTELDAIMEAKATAEQIRDIITELTDKSEKLSTARFKVNEIKGGILKYVQ